MHGIRLGLLTLGVMTFAVSVALAHGPHGGPEHPRHRGRTAKEGSFRDPVAPGRRDSRDRPFVFVSLPDTQVYSENRFPDGRTPVVTDLRGTAAIFMDQTRWIVRNVLRYRRTGRGLNIRYVGHLGDIVQRGEILEEWARAKTAMNPLLRADIPHGTVMGNHDDIPQNVHGLPYQKNYLDNFGPQVFRGRSWYAGASPSGAANWQLLEHDGVKIGFLNFSIDHPQSEVDWAQDILSQNRDTIFIIGTHRYLYDFKLAAGRYGEVVDLLGNPITINDSPVPGAVDPNSGQELFDELVRKNPNILMIHAGHFHSEWLRVDLSPADLNPNGQPIIQILTDYQSTRNGGDGWLRLYALDFAEKTFRFATYSPTLGRRRTTIDHFVETIYLAWEEREQIKAVLGLPPGPATDPAYLAFLQSNLQDTPAPDGFLLAHPDYDEDGERAYYRHYLEDLFQGTIPPGFGDITRFEALWLSAFAADPKNPLDFRDGARSPSYTLKMDYSKYYEVKKKKGKRRKKKRDD